jgi:hypothetical protein
MLTLTIGRGYRVGNCVSAMVCGLAAEVLTPVTLKYSTLVQGGSLLTKLSFFDVVACTRVLLSTVSVLWRVGSVVCVDTVYIG